jgi:hypothetical protein
MLAVLHRLPRIDAVDGDHRLLALDEVGVFSISTPAGMVVDDQAVGVASGRLHLQADDRRFTDAQRAIAERLAVGGEPVALEIEDITPRGGHPRRVAGEVEVDKQPLLGRCF